MYCEVRYGTIQNLCHYQNGKTKYCNRVTVLPSNVLHIEINIWKCHLPWTVSHVPYWHVTQHIFYFILQEFAMHFRLVHFKQNKTDSQTKKSLFSNITPNFETNWKPTQIYLYYCNWTTFQSPNIERLPVQNVQINKF